MIFHEPADLIHSLLFLQSAKDEAVHKSKKAAGDAAAAADATKHEAKGFGAKLWGKGQVRSRTACMHLEMSAGLART